jgi:hypothetical protein
MMTKQDTSHMGWSSFETWLINVYVTDDQGLYRWLTDLAQQDLSREEMAEALQRELYDLTLPDPVDGIVILEGTSLAAHLIQTSLERVNWLEIVESLESEGEDMA